MTKLVCNIETGAISNEPYSLDEIKEQEQNQKQYIARLPTIVREERNLLLSKTDWTQLLDVPQSIRDKWASYRQALRDVPQQAGFPDNITWPTKPE